MDDDDLLPLSAHGRSPSPLPLTRHTLVSKAHGQVPRTKEPIPWKMTPAVILQPGQPSKLPRDNPFRNKPKEIRATVVNGSSNLPVVPRPKFPSDWNLDHLKEKRRKSESPLPFKIDSKGKPLVPVALGSRQKMSSKS